MGDNDLQFQDFGTDARLSDVKAKKDAEGTTYEFEHSGSIGDREKLLAEDGRSTEFGSSPGSPSFWTFEYYQQFFDIDTDQVVNRLINSFVPRINGNFITQHIRPLPDLYGPFWIGVTLVFSTGIFGNLSQYIQTRGSQTSDHAYWTYDFRIVTAAASAIFTYVCIIPALLYALLWYRKSDVGYSYLEILCAYGYSLAIFVPVSMLWVINYEIVRWVLIGVAVFMSGSVLAFTFWPAVKHDQKLIGILTMIGILGLHVLLAAGFKHYFFQSAHDLSSPVESPTGESLAVGTGKPDTQATGAPDKINVPPPVKPAVQGAEGAKTPAKEKKDAENKSGKVEKSAENLTKKQEGTDQKKTAENKEKKEEKGDKKEGGTVAAATISVKSVSPPKKRRRGLDE